jgi:hypothetical protein
MVREELKDKSLIIEVVGAAVYPFTLQYAPKKLREDKDVVLAAVKKNGRALEFASKELRADPEVVSAAVRQDGCALQCASKELQGDREIVLAAVSESNWALEYASKELQEDRDDFLLDAVECNPFVLKKLNIGYGNERCREFHQEAIKRQSKHLMQQLKSKPENSDNTLDLKKLQEYQKKLQEYQEYFYDHAIKMLKNNCNPTLSIHFELRANYSLVRAILESRLNKNTIIQNLQMCFISSGGSLCDELLFIEIDQKIKSSTLDIEKKDIWETFKNDLNTKYSLNNQKPSIPSKNASDPKAELLSSRKYTVFSR